jgi:hypothetical protein
VRQQRPDQNPRWNGEGFWASIERFSHQQFAALRACSAAAPSPVIVACLHLPLICSTLAGALRPSPRTEWSGGPFGRAVTVVADPGPFSWPTSGLAAPSSRGMTSVPVVLFPLVPDRAHDNIFADDLEEDDVARAAEGNDQFARASIAQLRSAVGVG